MKIFIDPGHSGPVEPGACNAELRLTEADIALAIGLFLWKLLVAAGHEVKFSRGDAIDDTGIGNGDQLTWRTNKANEWGADLYICLHCNSFASPEAHGAEVLFAIGASKESKQLAAFIQAELVGLGLTDRGAKEQALFIRWANMPAVLIEHAFISNPDEAVMLRDRPLDFATADYNGIVKFLQAGGLG